MAANSPQGPLPAPLANTNTYIHVHSAYEGPSCPAARARLETPGIVCRHAMLHERAQKAELMQGIALLVTLARLVSHVVVLAPNLPRKAQ